MAVNLAQSMTGNTLPSDFVQGKLGATFNPGSLASFAGTIFEASVGALLGDKKFSDYAEQSVTSAFDLNIAGNDKLKTNFGIDSNVNFLGVKGSAGAKLMDSVARKIYQVTELGREAVSQRKIGWSEGASRPIITQNASGYSVDGQTFKLKEDVENYLSKRYTKGWGITQNPSAKALGLQWRGAAGYIPNFAAGSPLGDAINREMAAGVSPSKIRITQDGRLRNSGNPSGLAVINTRDEPNGRIPNFAKLKLESPEQQAARLAQRRAEPMFQSAQRQTIDWEPSPGSVARPMGGGAGPSRQVSYKKWADEFNKAADSAKEVGKSMDKGKFGMDKMFYAFSGITAATSILEETFKDSNTPVIIQRLKTALNSKFYNKSRPRHKDAFYTFYTQFSSGLPLNNIKTTGNRKKFLENTGYIEVKNNTSRGISDKRIQNRKNKSNALLSNLKGFTENPDLNKLKQLYTKAISQHRQRMLKQFNATTKQKIKQLLNDAQNDNKNAEEIKKYLFPNNKKVVQEVPNISGQQFQKMLNELKKK